MVFCGFPDVQHALPEFHRNSARIPNRSTLKKGITTTRPSLVVQVDFFQAASQLALCRRASLGDVESYPIREDLSTGYGIRFSTEVYGRKRLSTNTYRKPVLFLQKSPKVSGNLRESTGECNLGILYSSSLLPNHLVFMLVCAYVRICVFVCAYVRM